jgi:hypothetical protein
VLRTLVNLSLHGPLREDPEGGHDPGICPVPGRCTRRAAPHARLLSIPAARMTPCPPAPSSERHRAGCLSS